MALAAAVPGGGLLLASPVQAALRLFQLLPSAAFWQAAGNSSLRIFGGFLLSCALVAFFYPRVNTLGLELPWQYLDIRLLSLKYELLSCALAALLAALAAGRPWLRDLLAPPVAAVKAVPVASFIILALVWLDSRSLSLFISALMVFPPVYLNVLEGLCRTDRKLLELPGPGAVLEGGGGGGGDRPPGGDHRRAAVHRENLPADAGPLRLDRRDLDSGGGL